MRLRWIDSWKGLLIIFVVLGHVMGGAHHLSDGDLSCVLNMLFLSVYMFHMPAFFLLAGWFAGRKDTEAATLASVFFRKTRRLLVPYYVFGVLSALLYAVLLAVGNATIGVASSGRCFAQSGWNIGSALGSIAYGANWPGTDAFRCNGVLWFLPCMFSIQMIDWTISHFAKNRNRIFDLCLAALSLFLAACLQKMSVPSLPYALHQVPWFYTYFLIGRILPKDIPCLPGKHPVINGLSLAIFATVYFGVCLAFPCYDRYEPKFFLQVGVLLLALSGIAMSCMAAQVFNCKWLAAVGRASIGIMLMHKFVVMALQFGCGPIKSLFAQGALPCMAGIVLVTFVATALSYVATIVIRSVVPWALGEKI